MKLVPCVLGLAIAAAPLSVQAHWCSNIWTGPARLVIKPESTSVAVTAAGAALKVYFRNNFPYRIFGVKMAAGAVSGYQITVAPASVQAVGPGQQVLFTYTIKGTGTVQVSTMNLQVSFRVGSLGNSSPLVNQSPAQTLLVSRASSSAGQQAKALSAATLADKFPSATLPSTSPYFGRTGMQQLINWFGYRFCYSDTGGWRSSGQNCPSPAQEGAAWSSIDVFPQDCMRAGVEIGARKATLGSNLDPARAGAINAMKAGSAQHRCLAAVVGGLLWQGGSSASFETALDALSAPCKAAGLRALGKGATSACTAGQYWEKAACAAAEGLQGNDAVVTSVLVPNAGDGQNTDPAWQTSLYHAYLLYLVTMDRYASGKGLTWYAQVGPTPDAAPVKKDTGGVKPPDSRPPLLNEAGQPIPVEAGVPPARDGGSGSGGEPAAEGEGGCGCAMSGSPAAPALLLFLLLSIVIAIRWAPRSRRDRSGRE